MTGSEPRKLPLEDLHVAASARFGPFAGWSMPLTYPPGVMKEHLHAREHAGLFDISHMQLFELSGPGAADLIAKACPLDAASLAISQSKYTFFLNEQAGIIDDLIVTRLGDERFMIVANAGNAAEDEAHLRKLAADSTARSMRSTACSWRSRDRKPGQHLRGPASRPARCCSCMASSPSPAGS